MRFVSGALVGLAICGSVAMASKGFGLKDLPDGNYQTKAGDLIEVSGGRAALISIKESTTPNEYGKGYYSVFLKSSGELDRSWPYPTLKVGRKGDWEIESRTFQSDNPKLEGVDESRLHLKGLLRKVNPFKNFHPFRRGCSAC